MVYNQKKVKFMSQIVLSDIEQSVLQLSAAEQLLLISRVAEKLRGNVEGETEFENQLAEMADDAEIQRELNEIEADFRQTEFDGKNLS